MDLRTGTAVWELDDAPPLVFPRMENDLSCDVAIVGGGITGTLVAHELTNSLGLDCVLIDRARPGAGSTAASTALLLYDLDTPLHVLAEKIGEADAALAYRACLGAISDIEKLIRTLGVPCDFRRRKSFYLAEHEREVSMLAREYRLRHKHGFEVDLLSRADIASLFSFSRPAALLSQDAAELDVVKFVEALAANGQARGLRAFGETELQKVERHDDGQFLLRMRHGPRITARRIIFATGYATNPLCAAGHIGDLKSTYALATAPIADFAGWHERALLWTTARPYLYLRTTASRRAIIGGEDVPFADDKKRDALLPEKTAVLERALREFFPEMRFEIACAWTGTFAETKDSLAFIGESPDTPGIYFALGYGGNGIAYSMVAAQILREAFRGRAHPAAHVFRLNRRA
jgi:glycine/D-amino acid oxidase-like deaminating enzyme